MLLPVMLRHFGLGLGLRLDRLALDSASIEHLASAWPRSC